MSPGVRWAAAGGWWLLPTCILLGLAILLVDGAVFDPSPVSVGTLGASSVVVVAPVVAAGGAWSGGRLRRARWTRRPWRRSLVIAVVEQIWPHASCGAAAVAVCVVAAMTRYGVRVVPDPLPILAAVAMVAAAAVSGFALGWWLREVAAAPLALGCWYYLLAFPPALEPTWVRHLVVVRDCCHTSRSLDPAVVLSIITSAGAIGALALGALAAARQRLALPAGALVAVVLAGGAVALVHDRGPDPTMLRTGSLLCTEPRDGPALCVWPEHRELLPRVDGAPLGALLAVAEEARTDLPLVLTEDEAADQARGERFLVVRPDDSDSDLVRLVAGAVFPALSTRCVAGLEDVDAVAPHDASALYDAQHAGRLWWVTRAVLADAGVALDEGPAVAEDLAGGLPPAFEALWAAEPDEQRAWLEAAGRAVVDCDPGALP